MNERKHLAAAATLVVVLVVLLFFRDVVLGGQVFFERDIQVYWLGQTASLVRQWAAGSWPLWDPSQSFGQPFLANPSTQVLYPWTWLSFVLAPETQYTVFAVGHIVLSAVGFLLLARYLGLSVGAASVSALVWALSGPLLSLVSLWHHLSGAALIPWVMLAAWRTLDRPEAGSILGLAVAAALQILAGSADMVLMTGLAVAALVLSRVDWRAPTRPPSGRTLKALALAAALALAISAALWLPAWESAQGSNRMGLPASQRLFWSLHPLNALQLLVPLQPQHLPLDPRWWDTLYGAASPFLGSIYLGLAGLPLVLTAFRRGAAPARFLAAIGAGALVMALGSYGLVYTFVAAALPFVRILRFPVKATIFVAFAWALLVGLGLEAWRRVEERDGAWRWRILAVGALVLAVATGLGIGLLSQALPTAAVAEARGTLLAVTAAALLAYGALAATRPARGWLVLVVAVAAVADLGLAHARLNPTAPRGTFTSPPPVVRAIPAGPPARLFVFDYSDVIGKSYSRPPASRLYVPPSGALEGGRALWSYPLSPTSRQWGLESAFDRDPLGLAPPYAEALAGILRLAEETPGFLRLLRMGSVQYVIALHTEGLEDLEPLGTFESLFPAPVRLFRVPRPLPEAYVVGQGVRADGRQALAALADPAFDPEKTVLLASGDAAAPAVDFEGMARVVERKPDLLRAVVEAKQEGYLVITRTFDPSWRATVDGQPVAVQRANLAFQAVRVPAGRHVVETAYRPASVAWGLLISASGLLALLALAIAVARRARPGAVGASPGEDRP